MLCLRSVISALACESGEEGQSCEREMADLSSASFQSDARPDLQLCLQPHSVRRALGALMEDSARIHLNIDNMRNIISMLEALLIHQKHTYRFERQDAELWKQIESLHNLIEFLKLQAARACDAVAKKGWKKYLSKALGDDLGRISKSMLCQLQSWLDQEGVRELAGLVMDGLDDDKVQAISAFRLALGKGYDPQMQDTILSSRIAEKLVWLLAPSTFSCRVQEEAALAVIALLDFNKDIFLSLILMAGAVENLLGLLDGPNANAFASMHVLKNLLTLGHSVVVEEIYFKNGIGKLVGLLDRPNPYVQHAAMETIFEIAYNGRFEIVNELLKLDVVEKLARLQNSGICLNEKHEKEAFDQKFYKSRFWKPAYVTRFDKDVNCSYPFMDALARFAIHVSFGQGLRSKERHALKQLFFKHIKEVIDDDAEIANITAEVLWA